MYSFIERVRERFGLKKCSLDNLLWNVFWMMRSITVNVDSQSDFKAGPLHYAFGIICFVVFAHFYLVGLFYNVIWIYPNTRDLLTLAIIVSLAFSSQISTMKIIAVKLMRKRIMTLIDKYRSYEATVDPQSRYAQSALSALRPVKRRALIFWTAFCTGSIVYLTLPAFLPGRNFPENGLKVYGLEPMTETPNYEIAYTLQLLAGVFATAGISNVTALFIVLSGYIEAHLLAMATEFDNLWQDTLLEIQENVPENKLYHKRQDHVKERLCDLVQKHVTFLECHKFANDLFNEVIALEFLLTVIAMCSMLLGGLEDTYLQIPYTIAQLVVDTIVGQRLIDSGEVLEMSVYKCGWENFDAANMKTIQLVLQSSQKTVKLTAGNITFLGYVCFTSIVRFVYSSYATLRQAMDK